MSTGASAQHLHHLPAHLQLAASLLRAGGGKARVSRRPIWRGGCSAGRAGIGRRSGGGGSCARPDRLCGRRCELNFQSLASRGFSKVPGIVLNEDDKAAAGAAMDETKPFTRKRPSLQPKKLELRASGQHGNSFISFVQILGTGMDTRDTSPSVLLFFDKRRIIFNAGELDHVFLTRICSETASGLPGLLLTLSNTGEAGMAVNVWGPSDLKFLVDAMRTFIPNSSVVHTHSFGEGKEESPSRLLQRSVSPSAPEGEPLVLLEDEVVKISAVILRPGSSQPSGGASTGGLKVSTSGTEERRKSPSRPPLSKIPKFTPAGAETDGLSFSFAEPWELGFEENNCENPRYDDGRSESNSAHMLNTETQNQDAGTQRATEGAVVYICELPEIPGKFDPAKARAKRLRPGPKYGQLQAGKSVLSDDGKETVHPSDVMDPPSAGPICLVVDCPTMSHIASLVSAPGLKSFLRGSLTEARETSPKKVTCMAHLGPVAVVCSSQYREWMALFEGTHHLMAGHGMDRTRAPILVASARITSRLNYICPRIFPFAGLQPLEDGEDDCRDHLKTISSVTVAENLLKFRLRPISATPLDRSLVPAPLDVSSVQADLLIENPALEEVSKRISKLWSATPGGVAEGSENLSLSQDVSKQESAKESAEEADRAWSSTKESFNQGPPADNVAGVPDELPDCLRGIGRQEMELVFLGTGSSQPSKYRNVSSIYVHLFNRGGILLDCGEGTYAQLKRRYGNKAADDIIGGIKCVWISHIHADHHTGLARILSVRKKVLEREGRSEPVLVIGPKLLKRYLDAYEKLEDLGMEFLDCSQSTLSAEQAASSLKGFPTSKSSQEDGNKGNSNAMENLNGLNSPVGGLIRFPSTGASAPVDAPPARSQLRSYWLQSGFHFQAGLDEGGRKKLKSVLSDLGLSELVSVPVVHCPHAFGVVLVARGKKLLEPGWKLVYSGDTRPCQALVDASKGATVLIHEATFDDEMPEEAIAKSHSTTREAIETGITAGAYRTILTHFSQRYPKIPVFNESYNDRTCVAFDMMSVNLADLSVLPRLLPDLKLLFETDELVAEGAEDGLTV